jgi:hypothetical protein
MLQKFFAVSSAAATLPVHLGGNSRAICLSVFVGAAATWKEVKVYELLVPMSGGLVAQLRLYGSCPRREDGD